MKSVSIMRSAIWFSSLLFGLCAWAAQQRPDNPNVVRWDEGQSIMRMPTRRMAENINAPVAVRMSNGASVSALLNPGTGVIDYSLTADDPETHTALGALAANLGNDPIRIYEWVRNNVSTEFYVGGNRGAYLTMLEEGGSDVDQAALLGALLRAAGYVPEYHSGRLTVSRTATGPNKVGVYEWLCVEDDASALEILNKYTPSIAGDKFSFDWVWVTVNLPGRGTVTMVPSIKKYFSGRHPDTSAMAGYSRAIAISKAQEGMVPIPLEAYQSPKINRQKIKDQLASWSWAASEQVRNHASLHDLSGAELAHLRTIIPELVTLLAPSAVTYPENLEFGATQALERIPRSFLGRYAITVGVMTHWIDCVDLLGRSITIEFSPSGGSALKLGSVVVASEAGGGAGSNVSIELSYHYPPAGYAGTPPSGTTTLQTQRQRSLAIIYGFGRTANRLREQVYEMAARQAASGINATAGEMLSLMGLHYVSQAFELGSVAAASMGYVYSDQIRGGFAKFDSTGRPGLHFGISHIALRRTRANASQLASTYWMIGLLNGALEGTATEQVSGSIAFGAPTTIDYADRGGRYVSSISELSGLTNFSDAYLGSGAVSLIQSHISSGGKAFVLENSSVSYSGQQLGAFYLVSSNGAFGSYVNSSKGGAGTNWDEHYFKLMQEAQAKNQKNNPTVSKDPVDLATGAFYLDNTDLILGDGNEPLGLRLDRHYSSARRFTDQTGMGKGWTHNYDVRLQFRNPYDIDSRTAGIDEVLPVIIAARLIQDMVESEASGRAWLMASTAARWAADAQLRSRAAIEFGKKTVVFVKTPAGAYRSPPGMSATLQPSAIGFELEFQFGDVLQFRASDGRMVTRTDAFGNTLSAQYSGERLSRVTDAYGRYLEFYYDAGGRLYQVGDSTGRSVLYGRQGTDFTFTDPVGSIQRYEMTASGLLTKIIDARGRTVVENDYDQSSKVYRQRILGESARTLWLHTSARSGVEVDPAGGVMRTYFDGHGRRVFQVDQAGRLTTWQFDGVGRLVRVISPLGNTRAFSYYPNHSLASEVNPAGHTRSIINDPQGRPWKVRNFEGQETVTTYKDGSREVEIYDPEFPETITVSVPTLRPLSVTQPGGIASSFVYDERGRLWKHHPAHYAPGEFDIYTYDARGHVDKITRPGGGFDDFTYDVRGNMTETTDRRGARTTFDYNARRQRTKATQWEGTVGHAFQTFYDAVGDVDYTLDASGRKEDFDYDALGNLLTVRRGPIGAQVATLTQTYSDPRTLLTQRTDGEGNSTLLTYYATQELHTVRDALSRTTSFAYDADGRQTTVTTPLAHSTTDLWDVRGLQDGVQDAEGRLVDYTYDKNGRLTALANRRNETFTWNYNDAERFVESVTPTGKITLATRNTRGLPEEMIEPSGQATIYDAYDAEGRLTQKNDNVADAVYSYWPNGLLKEVTENGSTTYREYDALNRLIRYDDGEDNSITYEYYPSGELKKIVYPGNKPVTYAYDDFGRLWKVTDWAGRVTEYLYDNASRLVRVNRANGTYRIQVFDAASQFTGFREYTAAGALFLYQDLRYDADGRIEKSFLHPMPAEITLPFDTMDYDTDNRLSLFNSASVTHDADGNMTYGPLPSGALGAYVYDARNRLLSAGGSSYRYNPDGIRVEINGTGAATFVIDPNAPLSRTLMRTKGGVTAYYVYGLSLLYEEVGGATKHYHTDQVGSTLAMTDGAGNVTDRWSYAPYGKEFRLSGSTDTPFRFNGAYGVQSDSSGLLHMRARYYNPRLIRFCNADPIGFSGGLNWYAFVENNPVSLIDPKGLTIQYANHQVQLPFPWYHSKLILIPDNQAAYVNDIRFTRTNAQKLHFATLGAGPENGLLTSGVNRPRDVSAPAMNIRNLPIPSRYANEDEAIAELLKLNEEYNNNKVSYTLFPVRWTPQYNSNSYISGLLMAAGFDWFSGTGANTPGWYPNWVPADYFKTEVTVGELEVIDYSFSNVSGDPSTAGTGGKKP